MVDGRGAHDVSESGQFTAAKNGNVVRTWSNLRVDDLDTYATISVPGTWSAGERIGRGKR